MGLDGDFSRQGPKFNCLWIILLSGGLSGWLSPHPTLSSEVILGVKLVRKGCWFRANRWPWKAKMSCKESLMVDAMFYIYFPILEVQLWVLLRVRTTKSQKWRQNAKFLGINATLLDYLFSETKKILIILSYFIHNFQFFKLIIMENTSLYSHTI